MLHYDSSFSSVLAAGNAVVVRKLSLPCLHVTAELFAPDSTLSNRNLNMLQQALQADAVASIATLFFGRIRKIAKSFVTSVRLSIHMEQLGSHLTDFDEI